MDRFLVVLLTVLACSCSSAQVVPGPVATPARLSIRLLPQMALSGSDVWVTCTAPFDEPGRIALSLEGNFSSEAPLESYQFRRLAVNVPCGTWTVTCEVRTALRHEHAKAELVVIGECQ